MASAHPAVALLLISGLAIYWLIPLTAWFMLRGQNDRLSTIWFSGATAYALSVSLFVLGQGPPTWLTGPVTASLGLASVLCFVEAMRQELVPTPWPRRLYLGLLAADLGMLVGLLEIGRFHDLGRTIHLVILSVVDAWVALLAWRVARERTSRALWIVVIVFGMIALVNLLRAGEYLALGRHSGILSFSPIGNIGLLMNYLAGIFYCYGYWGFVLEKSRARWVRATQAAAESRAREEMAERIAAISQTAQAGAMSAAVTHEISQPLAAIQLNVEHVQTLVGPIAPDHPMHGPLVRLQLDVRRMGEIIHRMRRLFAQDPDADAILHTPDQVVREVMELIQRPLKKAGVNLSLELAGPPQVHMAAGELEQVLLNLMNNAMEALAEAGTAAPQILVRTWEAEGMMHLSVRDNGPGIQPKVQTSIFEMRYSTKHGNMGMGLWLSAFIVARRGGKLQFDPTWTHGARFEMTMPAR